MERFYRGTHVHEPGRPVQLVKRFYRSKTIIFNVLTAVVVLATMLGFTPNQEVAEVTTGLLVALAPIVNIILRTVTNKSITL